MSGPGVIPVVAGTTVLGERIFKGQGLPATGIAIGIYVVIGVLCLALGVLARWHGSRIKTAKG